MTDFDPESFAALYAGRSLEIDDLARSLAKMHALALRAFKSHSERAKSLNTLSSTLGQFNIGLGDFAEGRQAAVELEQESRSLQETSSNHALKGLLVLDKLLEKAGSTPDERAHATGQARDHVLRSLPENMRQAWTVYFEQIEIIIASADQSSKAESGSVPRPRL